MTTKYIDSKLFSDSFLTNYEESISCQVLADTFHDEINVLKKVKLKKLAFDDNLVENSKQNNIGIQEIASKFTEFVYADLAKKESVEIEQKKKSELFVVDVFSGSYQIMGINNLLDCTANQNADTIQKKLTSYNKDSPTRKYSNIFNCDELLFSYFKKNKNTWDRDTRGVRTSARSSPFRGGSTTSTDAPSSSQRCGASPAAPTCMLTLAAVSLGSRARASSNGCTTAGLICGAP
jgi:hypothetical protein